MNKVNPYPALTAPLPLIFLSNLFIAFEAKFLTDAGKVSLTKGIYLNYLTYYKEVHQTESF